DLAEPFLAAIVAFTAALCLGIGVNERVGVARMIGAVATAAAVLGLVGVGLRITPLVMPAQKLPRLNGPLTYAHAAGRLSAIGLLVVAGSDDRRHPIGRLALFFLGASLVATLSRGGFFAVGAGFVMLDRRSWRQLARPLIAVALVAPVLVATATSS